MNKLAVSILSLFLLAGCAGDDSGQPEAQAGTGGIECTRTPMDGCSASQGFSYSEVCTPEATPAVCEGAVIVAHDAVRNTVTFCCQ